MIAEVARREGLALLDLDVEYLVPVDRDAVAVLRHQVADVVDGFIDSFRLLGNLRASFRAARRVSAVRLDDIPRTRPGAPDDATPRSWLWTISKNIHSLLAACETSKGTKQETYRSDRKSVV